MASLETSRAERADRPGTKPERWRIGIRDLVIWVVGAAVLAAVLRLVRMPALVPGTATRVWYEVHLLDVIAATLAVAVGMRLVGQLVRGTKADEGLSAAVVWRAVAVAALVGLLAAEGWQLREFAEHPDAGYRSVERRLATVCLWLLAGGLLAGMRATPRPQTQRKARASWLTSALVWVFALGCILFTMPFAYLVLLALEAVGNASRVYRGPHEGVALRVLQTVPTAGFALLACIVTTAWIASDLRRLGAMPEPAAAPRLSTVGLVFRLCSLLATVGAAVYVVLATIPWIHEWLAAGIWMALLPDALVLIGIGLAGSSAGIVARVIGRLPGAPAERRGWRRLFELAGKFLVILGLVAVSFIATASVLNELGQNPWLASPLLSDLADAATKAWLLNWESDMPAFLYLPACLWALWQAIVVCGPQAADRPAALDLALQPGLRGRFLGLWASLCMLCWSALPILFVSGLALFQIRLMGWHWPPPPR